MYLFQCKSTCNKTDLTTFNITTYDDLKSLKYYTNSTTSCNFYICNSILQMNEQGVDDISKVNASRPTSFDPSISALTQIQQLFQIVDPVFFQIFLKSVNKTSGFTINDYVEAKMMIKNTTVIRNCFDVFDENI